MQTRRPEVTLLLAVTLLASPALAHDPVMRARTPIELPDIPGYLTLKCDFHMHTVFSDGLVWPSVRAEEAWREGLDAIAITDHIEYQPHEGDVTTNRNRSFEIAWGASAALNLIVIHGSEITRQMPPGHLNAIFITNSEALAVPDWRNAARAAHAQGGFIFWNHPSFPGNSKMVWYKEHTWLLDQGLLQGIEVVNGRTYLPKSHQWAIEKHLTMLSNSDIHRPLNLDYHVHEGDHRPITLVFTKARTAEAIHEALLNRRTAVYSGDRLIGEEQFLKPIFEGSIELLPDPLELEGKARRYVQIHNRSDLDYSLERVAQPDLLEAPAKIILPAHRTVLMAVRARTQSEGRTATTVPVAYRVMNLLVGPDQPLQIVLPLSVTFSAAGR